MFNLRFMRNIKYIFNTFANSNIKIVPAAGNDTFNLFSKIIPPGGTITLNYTQEKIELYQFVEGYGILHITDLDMSDRSFSVKAGEAFVFESQGIKKIENIGQTHLVVILGSYASHFSAQKSDVNLTDRQLQVLFFLLRGNTTKQIARILKLSNRTVDDYLEQLRVKFSVQNKNDLVNKTIDCGFLNIIPESLFRLKLIQA